MILIEEVKIQDKSVGLVVAVGIGIVGYSICNPIEKKFIFGRGVEIAIGRAMKTGAVSKLESIMRDFKSEYNRSRKDFPGPTNNKRYDELPGIIQRMEKVFYFLDKIKRRSMQVL